MHQVYALHVGSKRTTRSQFLYREPSDGPLVISFYVWVVLGGPEPIVYDVAFDAEHASARGLYEYNDRAAMLKALGIDPDAVKTVVMSHLHWDHWSGHGLFPNATFLVQRSEAAFWTGRATRHALIMESADRKALHALLALDEAGRIRMLDGGKDLWPGLRLVVVGGHTPGLQVLAVDTARGLVVLASDTLHFYENFERRRPVQATLDMPQALEAFDLVAELAGGSLIVAGHDPADCEKFDQVAPGVFKIA
jgi:glyoxylase-like metal-dependent hydrolase (beta-lactamase superfamily II)